MRTLYNVFLVAFVLSITIPTLTVAQDPLKVSPSQNKLLLENPKVRVYEFTVKPGEKLAMHSHPDNVVYFTTSGKIKFSYPDGKTKEVEVREGQALWSDPVTHAAENIGATTIHGIVTELNKSKAKKK